MMGEGEGRAMQITDFSDLYTEEERARFAACRELAPGLAYRPLISIVVPVYRTPVRLLNEMISSVVRQSYPEWELCIGNASGDDRELCRALEEWQRQDARIRVCTLAENKGISGNTNACFQMARGEYTAMLDHDDLLTESALCEVALCLQGKEGERPDFLYSDQDMVDEGTKKRFNPLYKPGWSKDMMYSGNYITHFSVLRTSLIREIGGWDATTDGAQDWDLFLKAAEHTDRIVGIPRILYHWRMASTSTASSMETKGYALDAQLRAVEGHLRRMGEPQARVHFYNRDIFKLQVVWNRRHEGDISVVIFDEGKRGSLWLLASLVRAALRLGLKLRKVPKAEIDQKVKDAARILDLEKLLDRKPKALSGGQRQRVAMGRAIVRNPKVFLMDEPLSNLDAKLRVQMRIEISKLHENLGATIIYVTHDQTEAMTLGTRIVVMKDGVVQQVDTPQNLYNTPCNLFVAGFIGSPQMNFLDAVCNVKGDDVTLTVGKHVLKVPASKKKALIEGGYDGKTVILGIRPEDVHDSEAFISNSPDSVIESTIKVYELLGAEVFLYFDVEGVQMTARVNPRTTLRTGDKAVFALDMEKIHVFDKETELTITN